MTEYVTRSDVTTTTITVPGEGEVITVTEPTTVVTQTTTTITLPGDSETTTLTVPGEGEVVTVTEPTTVVSQTTTTITLPGEFETTTVTLPGELEITTLTIPGEGEIVTVTEPTTLPAETQISTVTTTLAAEVTTVTIPGEAEMITVTESNTLPGETQTFVVTTTLSAETRITTTTIPASTVTVTVAAAPTCPTEVIENGSFEATFGLSWSTLIPVAGGNLDRTTSDAADGQWSTRARSLSGDSIMHLQQAVSLCAGSLYRVSWQSKRLTSSGASVNIQAFVGNTLVSNAIPSGVWAPAISPSFMIPAQYATTVLRFTIIFRGSTGITEEVLIDDIKLTKIG